MSVLLHLQAVRGVAMLARRAFEEREKTISHVDSSFPDTETRRR